MEDFLYNTERAIATLAEGSVLADIYAEATEALIIEVEDGKVEKVSWGEDSGVGLRSVDEKFVTRFGFSNEFSRKTVEELARELKRAEPERALRLLKAQKTGFSWTKVPVRSRGLDEKIKLLLEAHEVASNKASAIKRVKVTYVEVLKKVGVVKENGGITLEDRSYVRFSVQAVAEKEGELFVGYESVGCSCGLELFEEHPPERVAEVAAYRALLQLTARPAPGGRMTVVLASSAGGTMIHEAVGHGLEADHAEEGLSVYSGRLGETVASPLITVIDDPTLPSKSGSFLFDDEGTEAQRVVLIENGVLKDFLYDRLTALKYGKSSNGHGRRESYRYIPIPRMSNTYIAPGPHSPEEILRSVEKGLLVRKMGGGEVNPVTGDFVFEVTEGYLIEKGEVVEPVRGATLVGNGPEVLKSIDMVGNDLGFGIGICGKDGQGVPVSDAQPTLRIPEMTVGGAL